MNELYRPPAALPHDGLPTALPGAAPLSPEQATVLSKGKPGYALPIALTLGLAFLALLVDGVAGGLGILLNIPALIGMYFYWRNVLRRARTFGAAAQAAWQATAPRPAVHAPASPMLPTGATPAPMSFAYAPPPQPASAPPEPPSADYERER